MTAELGHFINGKRVAGNSGRLHDVYNPTIGEVQSKVALASRKEVETAISAAEKAFPGWAGTNPQRRARVLFKFKELVEKDMNNLAKMLSSEHGKILPDARVIGAFHNLSAEVLLDPNTPLDADVLVTGGDQEAKRSSVS